MASLDDAISLFSQSKLKEGLSILFELHKQPNPVEKSFLIWAIVLKDSPFRYLAVEAAQREIQHSKNADATALFMSLINESSEARSKCHPGLPKISFIGIINNDNQASWARCADSLSFQRYVNVELCLCCDETFVKSHHFGSFVKFFRGSNSVLECYEVGVSNCSGDLVSIIEDATTVVSDKGLHSVANFFQGSSDRKVVQTERVTAARGGFPEAMRSNFPEWDQSSLLNPLNLDPPTTLFTWQNVFFCKEILLSVLPFDKQFPNVSAFDVATKLINKTAFHTLKSSVFVTNATLYARAPLVSLIQRSEALTIIDRETRRYGKLDSKRSITEESPNSKSPNGMELPQVAPELLIRGKDSNVKISLVTASYNCKQFIEACIDSVLSQNYPNLEYIIIDGDSDDGTKQIIQRYEKYLAHFRSARDGGQYYAIQEGINRSTGGVMSWINADDRLCPYTLSLVASLFSERKEISWITGIPALITESDILDISRECSEFSPEAYLNDDFDDPFIQQEGTFWTRDIWNKAGGALDLRYSLAADMELWTRFFQIAPVYTSSVPLGIFRKRRGQRSEVYKEEYFREAVRATEKLRVQGAVPVTKTPGKSYIIDVPVRSGDIALESPRISNY